MAKEFNYKDEGREMNRIANEIISLLNEYNLEKPYIEEILDRVGRSVDNTIKTVKLTLELTDPINKRVY